MKRKRRNGLSQIQMIAFGFFLMIIIGTLLLMLPISAKGEPASFLEALFTTTSAGCVTGLIVVDTYCNWSLFGQVVIITLIQIGGLGFVTIGVLFSLFLRRKISLRERELLQESINAMQLAGVVRLVKLIIQGTLLIEGTGAILLSIRFIPRFGFWKGCYFSIFHAISAFCNAGFDLMGGKEPYMSLVDYVADPLVNLVIMSLIVIGGIGFIVWQDIYEHGFHVKKYMLHTKIVLLITTILIFGSAFLFWLLEREALFADLSPMGKVWAALFSSVTARTAGFNTVDTGALSNGSKLLTMVLMLIGGSPGSTAGGIKTTTVVVMIMYTWNSLRNRSGCNIFERRLSDEAVQKAGMVIVSSLSLALTGALIICGCHPELPMDAIMFEIFSAIGTVGMTMGITRDLGTVSRCVLIFLMYCGRIGSMTFALSFMQKKKKEAVQYPLGNISIG